MFPYKVILIKIHVFRFKANYKSKQLANRKQTTGKIKYYICRPLENSIQNSVETGKAYGIYLWGAFNLEILERCKSEVLYIFTDTLTFITYIQLLAKI